MNDLNDMGRWLARGVLGLVMLGLSIFWLVGCGEATGQPKDVPGVRGETVHGNMGGTSISLQPTEVTTPVNLVPTSVTTPGSNGGQLEALRSTGGFRVEVLVDGRSVPTYYANGKTYIEAKPNTEYALRITNPLSVRVGAAVAVDGLNSIDATTGTARDAAKWLLQPHETLTLKGWQVSSKRARRFYFTTEADSYGAKLGQTTNLGVISAVFFRERRPVTILREESRDRVEPNEAAKAPAPSTSTGSSAAKSVTQPPSTDDYAATGMGRNTKNRVTIEDVDLEDTAAGSINLRYEFRPTLVKLGVLPANPEPLRRRENARGFKDTGFAPEVP